MPSFNVTLERARLQWRRIQDKPSEIAIVRGKSQTLSTQTVRIEYRISDRELKSPDSETHSSARDIIVFGIRDHDTEPETDIKRNDRFVWSGRQYRIDDVVFYQGSIQAFGVALS